MTAITSAVDVSPAQPLTLAEVTEESPPSTVFCMPTSWPVEEFVAYLRALMTEAGIPDYAELSRLSGVSQTQFSNWRKGASQPSRESLSKVAKVVHVKPVHLWLAAGVANADELDLSDLPDLEVLPREFVELIQLWRTDRLSEADRKFIRTSLSVMMRGIRSEVFDDPGSRRRTARKPS
jgi:transcriptional regulator with XRE-family HTH domain